MKSTQVAAVAMLNRCGDDEPVFVLRAQDKAAVHAITEWIDYAYSLGASKEKIAGAEEHRQAFLRWQALHPTKVPD